MNIVLVQCERLQKETGEMLPASYFASNIGDGYIYYNDYEFFRTWIKDDDNKYLTEIYYPEHSRWIETNNIDNMQLYDYNTGENLPTGHGVEAAVRYAIAVAESPLHGYNQDARLGNPDYDCSSLVYFAFVDGGGFTDIADYANHYPCTTYTMVSVYTQAGFTWHPKPTGWTYLNEEELHRGDILLFIGNQAEHTGHTAIYTGNGQLVHASLDENGNTTGGWPGDQKEEIVQRTYYDEGLWDGYLRYEGSLQPI